jgi:hypothetical protein
MYMLMMSLNDETLEDNLNRSVTGIGEPKGLMFLISKTELGLTFLMPVSR